MATAIKDFLTDEEMERLEKSNTPDFISDDEMVRIETAQPQPAKKQSGLGGFVSGIKDVIKRETQGLYDNALRDTNRGEPFGLASQVQYPIQQIGRLAAIPTGIIAEGAKSAVKAVLSDKQEEQLNGKIGEATQFAGNAISKIPGVPQVAKYFEELPAKNPDAAENWRALGNIDLGMLTGIGSKLAKEPSKEIIESIVSSYKKNVGASLKKPNKGFLRVGQGEVTDEIPDIDELAKSLSRESTIPLANDAKDLMTPKQIKAQVPDVPKRGALSRVAEDEANLLTEPITAKDTPFTDYALQARKAKANMREMTPMDIAGSKGVQALDEVSKLKQQIGQKIDEALKPLQQEHYEKGTLLSTIPIKQRWQEAVAKFMGGKFDESGNIVAVEGRQVTDPAESGLFKQLNDKIGNLPNGVTIKELADIKTAVRRLTDNYKASMAKPINSTAEAAGKNVNQLIDDIITGYAGPEYKDLSKKYGNLAKIEEQLSRRLGEVTDKEKGTARMGASLMKSAVQSNSDRGTKALFDAVKKVTGIDLVKDAGYAEIAMKAIGDSRINDLLQEVGAIKTAMTGGALDKALKIGEMGYNKLRGDKLDELVKYYNKQQGITNKSQGIFKSQRGSVGLAENPQVKSENFKKWFGDWENAPEQASKVVDYSGRPKIVYHGTPDKQEIMKDGTFKSQKERFGMGKDSHVHWFTDDPSTARTYADPWRSTDYQNAEPGLIDTYLDLKNPIVIDGGGKNWREAQKIGKTSDVIEQAKKNGHDGIIIENVYDTYNTNPGDATKSKRKARPVTTYAVFSPTQIKSATGNSGAFNPSNPDIRGSAAVPMLAGIAAGGAGAAAGARYIQQMRDKRNKK